MITRRLLLLAASTALLFGCQTPAPKAVTTHAVTYTCDDGSTVQAVYPDTGSAIISVGGDNYHLHVVVSGSGARYTGDQWQWWIKGMHDATLAPLPPVETIASATGTRCHAP